MASSGQAVNAAAVAQKLSQARTAAELRVALSGFEDLNAQSKHDCVSDLIDAGIQSQLYLGRSLDHILEIFRSLDCSMLRRSLAATIQATNSKTDRIMNQPMYETIRVLVNTLPIIPKEDSDISVITRALDNSDDFAASAQDVCDLLIDMHSEVKRIVKETISELKSQNPDDLSVASLDYDTLTREVFGSMLPRLLSTDHQYKIIKQMIDDEVWPCINQCVCTLRFRGLLESDPSDINLLDSLFFGIDLDELDAPPLPQTAELVSGNGGSSSSSSSESSSILRVSKAPPNWKVNVDWSDASEFEVLIQVLIFIHSHQSFAQWSDDRSLWLDQCFDAWISQPVCFTHLISAVLIQIILSIFSGIHQMKSSLDWAQFKIDMNNLHSSLQIPIENPNITLTFAEVSDLIIHLKCVECRWHLFSELRSIIDGFAEQFALDAAEATVDLGNAIHQLFHSMITRINESVMHGHNYIETCITHRESGNRTFSAIPFSAALIWQSKNPTWLSSKQRKGTSDLTQSQIRELAKQRQCDSHLIDDEFARKAFMKSRIRFERAGVPASIARNQSFSGILKWICDNPNIRKKITHDYCDKSKSKDIFRAAANLIPVGFASKPFTVAVINPDHRMHPCINGSTNQVICNHCGYQMSFNDGIRFDDSGDIINDCEQCGSESSMKFRGSVEFGVIAKEEIAEGTFLGLYAGMVRTKPKKCGPLSRLIHAQLFRSFGIGSKLWIEATHACNELVFVNDSRDDSAGISLDRAEEFTNAEFLNVKIEGWECHLLRTTQPICKHQEILVHYGRDYWNAADDYHAGVAEARAKGEPIPSDSSSEASMNEMNADMAAAMGNDESVRETSSVSSCDTSSSSATRRNRLRLAPKTGHLSASLRYSESESGLEEESQSESMIEMNADISGVIGNDDSSSRGIDENPVIFATKSSYFDRSDRRSESSARIGDDSSSSSSASGIEVRSMRNTGVSSRSSASSSSASSSIGGGINNMRSAKMTDDSRDSHCHSDDSGSHSGDDAALGNGEESSELESSHSSDSHPRTMHTRGRYMRRADGTFKRRKRTIDVARQTDDVCASESRRSELKRARKSQSQ